VQVQLASRRVTSQRRRIKSRHREYLLISSLWIGHWVLRIDSLCWRVVTLVGIWRFGGVYAIMVGMFFWIVSLIGFGFWLFLQFHLWGSGMGDFDESGIPLFVRRVLLHSPFGWCFYCCWVWRLSTVWFDLIDLIWFDLIDWVICYVFISCGFCSLSCFHFWDLLLFFSSCPTFVECLDSMLDWLCASFVLLRCAILFADIHITCSSPLWYPSFCSGDFCSFALLFAAPSLPRLFMLFQVG